MTIVRRYDRASPPKWERLPNGYLRADAFLSRAECIQEYKTADGSVRREYRPAAEVFSEDSLKSFQLAPITLEHPPGLLDAENTRAHQVGTVGESIKQDGDKVAATVLITDAQAVADVLAKRRCELSCGYLCDLDPTPGEFNGQRYDAIQRRIHGNHVALTMQGRAGPEVRIRIDSGDAIQTGLTRQPTPEGSSRGDAMAQVQINGLTFEVADQAAQALRLERETQAKLDSSANEKVKAAETAAEMAKAALAAAEKKADEAEKARKDALDPAAVQARVTARLALLERARPHLDSETVKKADAMADRDLKLAALKKLRPDEKFDDKSDEHLSIWFDALAAATKTDSRVPGLPAGVLLSASDLMRTVAAAPGQTKNDSAEAYTASLKTIEESWKLTGADLAKRLNQ